MRAPPPPSTKPSIGHCGLIAMGRSLFVILVSFLWPIFGRCKSAAVGWLLWIGESVASFVGRYGWVAVLVGCCGSIAIYCRWLITVSVSRCGSVALVTLLVGCCVGRSL